MINITKSLIALFILSLFTVCTYANGNITIANNSKSSYAIIIPDNSPTSLIQAASELQKDINLASGAQLAIKTGSPVSSKHYISLGMTKQAKGAGFSTKNMAIESWRIVTKNSNLYIFGPDTPQGGWTKNDGTSTGTANGVYTFLENQLGVRWLMPGALGRVVPKQKVITINSMDKTGAPKFHYRRLPYANYYADATQLKAIDLWKAHLRVGYKNASVYLSHSHNWWGTINRTNPHGPQGADVNTKAVRKLYKQHRDWFAMNSKGKRPYPTNRYSKLETTNPGLVKWFAEQAVKHLKANKRPATYSLSPSDGSLWSQSPASKALYDPSPAQQFHNPKLSDRTSMSSLVVTWYDDIARIVQKEYPKGRLAGYIYASYLYPPQKVNFKLPKNFTPVIAPSFNYGYGLYRKQTRQQFHYVMNAWSKIAPQNWYYYDLPVDMARQGAHEIGKSGNFPGTAANVTPAAPGILNTIFSTLIKSHIDGCYIYGSPSWSSQAMSNYMLAKMMWNPAQNAYDVQRNWLKNAYGKKAAATMAQFYRHLNGWFKPYYQAHTHRQAGIMLTLDMLKKIYAAHYPQLENLYLQALNQTITSSQKKRLQLIGENLILLQWRLKNINFLPPDYKSKLTHSSDKIETLLNKTDKAFPLFPGVTVLNTHPYRKIKPAPFKVLWNNSNTAAKGQAPKMASDTFVLYAKDNHTITILPKSVKQSAYFASYRIKNSDGKVLSKGVLITGIPVEFKAEAGKAYYLYLPGRNHVNYVLDIKNAGIAKGQLKGKTLYLQSKQTAPVYIYYSGNTVGLMENGGNVKIARPFVGAKPVNRMRRDPRYSEARVLASLAEAKFHPDLGNNLMKLGVTKLDFNDSKWKTISTLNWWQFQGFSSYHGTGWYRITFTIPKLKKKETTRVYFGSVDGNATVYLNGRKITEHKIGPAPNYKGWNKAFSSWISPSWYQPGKNVLVVKVTSKSSNSASGITGGVAIIGRINSKK